MWSVDASGIEHRLGAFPGRPGQLGRSADGRRVFYKDRPLRDYRLSGMGQAAVPMVESQVWEVMVNGTVVRRPGEIELERLDVEWVSAQNGGAAQRAQPFARGRREGDDDGKAGVRSAPSVGIPPRAAFLSRCGSAVRIIGSRSPPLFQARHGIREAAGGQVADGGRPGGAMGRQGEPVPRSGI